MSKHAMFMPTSLSLPIAIEYANPCQTEPVVFAMDVREWEEKVTMIKDEYGHGSAISKRFISRVHESMSHVEYMRADGDHLSQVQFNLGINGNEGREIFILRSLHTHELEEIESNRTL